jgi:hypothetical protein
MDLHGSPYKTHTISDLFCSPTGPSRKVAAATGGEAGQDLIELLLRDLADYLGFIHR